MVVSMVLCIQCGKCLVHSASSHRLVIDLYVMDYFMFYDMHILRLYCAQKSPYASSVHDSLYGGRSDFLRCNYLAKYFENQPVKVHMYVAFSILVLAECCSTKWQYM